MQELQQLGVSLFLDERGARAQPADRLPLELREELRRLKSEVIQYLAEQGEQIIDDPEERAHSDRNSPPAPELSDADKVATSLKASKRMYMNGEVLVNHPNNMGAFMRRLREQDERRQAAERGELPPQGRYRTRFDIFG
jgi:TubC N-terminal docking domain